MLGFPTTLSKPPAARGAFDAELLDYLGRVVRGEVAKADEFIRSSAEESANRAGAVTATEGALEAAKAAEAASEEALAAAKSEASELQAKLSGTNKLSKEFVGVVKRVGESHGRCESDLEEFGEALAAFATERDGEAEAPTEPETQI